jgi:hypothetical protein
MLVNIINYNSKLRNNFRNRIIGILNFCEREEIGG